MNKRYTQLQYHWFDPDPLKLRPVEPFPVLEVEVSEEDDDDVISLSKDNDEEDDDPEDDTLLANFVPNSSAEEDEDEDDVELFSDSALLEESKLITARHFFTSQFQFQGSWYRCQ